MDTEDREHFRTIGSAPAGRLPDWPKKQIEGNSGSDHDRAYYPHKTKAAYCLMKANVLFGCYRKDEAHDPDIYAAAVSSVLSDYPKNIIDTASDPRTGIASTQKFLPSVAEVKEFCDALGERKERLKRYSELPAFRKSDPTPIAKTPDGQSFEEMFAKHGRPVGVFEKAGDKWNPR